jgi:hypothetical protein
MRQMSKILSALVCLVFVAACSIGTAPPPNLDNACSILRDRPNYKTAMKRAERKWGVPVAVQMATIHQESKFVRNAKAPRKSFLGIIPLGRVSSAKGYSQALDGTWDDYRDQTGRRLASRTNIADATDFIGWYMNGTKDRLGIPLTDARRQYLAYHEGRTGYARGSHNAKSWLLNVAKNVEVRAVTYDRQLSSCGMS